MKTTGNKLIGENNTGRIPVETAILMFTVSYDEGRKEMFYLKMHSTHFIYGYMASDVC